MKLLIKKVVPEETPKKNKGGRPPKGAVAMTPYERLKAHRERKKKELPS